MKSPSEPTRNVTQTLRADVVLHDAQRAVLIGAAYIHLFNRPLGPTLLNVRALIALLSATLPHCPSRAAAVGSQGVMLSREPAKPQSRSPTTDRCACTPSTLQWLLKPHGTCDRPAQANATGSGSGWRTSERARLSFCSEFSRMKNFCAWLATCKSRPNPNTLIWVF